MKKLTEKDLAHLNALADGELGGNALTTLNQRLEAEPHLKAAYEEIREVKRKLGSLSFERDGRGTAGPKASGLPHWRTLAIAASVVGLAVVATLIAGDYAGRSNPMRRPVDWHHQLSAGDYVVNRDHAPQFVSFGTASDFQVPDLSGAMLFLVELRTTGEARDNSGAVLHYRGLGGCRLTLWVGRVGDWPERWPGAASRTALRHWRIGDGSYALVASGMDLQRFAAIADYVEALTTLDAERAKKAGTAMADAYADSARCA